MIRRTKTPFPYTDIVAAPFIRWVGGKRKVIDIISALYPLKFNKYVELFVGGGAVFYNLNAFGKLKSINSRPKALLNDINKELIEAYWVIKHYPKEIIDLLKDKDRFSIYESTYYKIRAWNPTTPIERCARFIYLNRTGHRSMYRLDMNGDYNVPWGAPKYRKIFNYVENKIYPISIALQEVQLLNREFDACEEYIEMGDFIYMDPPSDAHSNKPVFNNYTIDGYNIIDQERVANYFIQLSNKGCFVMTSNHDTPLIRSLYADYFMYEFISRTMINYNGIARATFVGDLLITNY